MTLEELKQIPQPAQQQEPVAWISAVTGDMTTQDMSHTVSWAPLYTTPLAQRTWVGLTHEEKQHLNEVLNLQGRFPIIHAIEAKLMGKNTYGN